MKNILLMAAFIVIAGAAIFFMSGKFSNRNETSSPLSSPEKPQETPQTQVPPLPTENGLHLVTIQTNLGEIAFETYDADAPKTVENFVTLVQKRFYNGLTFHRVIKGFMIQGGDPSGNGTGGPGYKFDDELNPDTESYKMGYKRGVLAMANAGPNTNGSQFFILHQDYPLPHNYTIFGKVVAGQDVVDRIASLKTDANDRPLETARVENIRVEKIGQ